MNQTVWPSALGGRIAAMPSKSVSHRAVLLAALSEGETTLAPLLRSRDIEATLACCRALGLTGEAVLSEDAGKTHALRLSGRRPAGETLPLRTLPCGESGSTLRFLIPLALDGRGPVRFEGQGRLMQRPLSVYEALLRPLGVRWTQEDGALTVEGRLQSSVYALPGDVSSQFITGLLLALPLLPGDSALRLTTALGSRDYVELTRRVQAAFGLRSEWTDGGQTLIIPGGQTPRSPGHVTIEGDWSHAAFFLVAGALGNGVTVTGLMQDSAQADRAILPLLCAMGADIAVQESGVTVRPSALQPIEADVSQCPDLMPILSVAMAAAQGESRITGAARLRLKESDRLHAMAMALQAAGCPVRETADGLSISGGQGLRAAQIDGVNDHRIVMAMAVASALSQGPLTLTDAEAVAKSAPDFWAEFAALGGKTA